MKSELSKRLKRARKHAGLIQVSAANLCGWESQSRVGNYESGLREPKIDEIITMAKAYGVSASWLATGEGSMLDAAHGMIMEAAQDQYNTASGPAITGRIPLISWVRAGELCESPDNYAPGDAEEWLPAMPGMGKRTYALRVRGDSMTSQYPGQKSYPEGAVIYVDPDKEVISGKPVIATIPSGTTQNEATFKIYVEDAGKRYLKPINPTYDKVELTDEMSICGVIVGTWWPE